MYWWSYNSDCVYVGIATSCWDVQPVLRIVSTRPCLTDATVSCFLTFSARCWNRGLVQFPRMNFRSQLQVTADKLFYNWQEVDQWNMRGRKGFTACGRMRQRKHYRWFRVSVLLSFYDNEVFILLTNPQIIRIDLVSVAQLQYRGAWFGMIAITGHSGAWEILSCLWAIVRVG